MVGVVGNGAFVETALPLTLEVLPEWKETCNKKLS